MNSPLLTPELDFRTSPIPIQQNRQFTVYQSDIEGKNALALVLEAPGEEPEIMKLYESEVLELVKVLFGK